MSENLQDRQAAIEAAMRRHPANGRARQREVTVSVSDEMLAVMKAAVVEAGWCSDYTPETLLWQYLRLTTEVTR